MFDSDKLEAAKASFRRQMKWAGRFLLLLAIGVAYSLGIATGQVQRLNAACSTWIAAGNNFHKG